MQPSVKDPSRPRLYRVGEIAAQAGSLRPSDPGVRRGVHAGIVIVIALALGLAVVAATGDFPSVAFHLRPGALLLALGAMLVYLIGSGEIWRRLLRALGPRIDPVEGSAVWLASGLGRYVPAAVLVPVLRMAMCERLGVRKGICLASIAYELVLLFTASLIVSAYFVITLPDLQGAWERYIVLVLPVLGLFALHPRIFHTIANQAFARFGRDPLPLSLPARRVFEFFALYALANIVAGFAIYGLAMCLYSVGTDDLPTIIGSYAVANTLSILAFVIPGGLGAREAAMTAALSPVMPAAPAVAVAVLSRILQVGLEVLLASALTPVIARSGRGASAQTDAAAG